MPRSPRTTTKDLFDLFGGDTYDVAFSIVAACTLTREDPSHYMETIKGRIVRVVDDSDEETVGTLEAYRLRRDLADAEGISFADAADAFDQSTHDYLFEVFTVEGTVREHVVNALGGTPPNDGPVLMAHTLHIAPEHQGRGLGYAVLNSFIETFEPGASVVIGRAAPIDPDSLGPETMDDPERKRRRLDAVRKLRRYWRRFGFVPTAPGSEFLILNLEAIRPLVTDAIIAARNAKARRRTT